MIHHSWEHRCWINNQERLVTDAWLSQVRGGSTAQRRARLWFNCFTHHPSAVYANPIFILTSIIPHLS
ncbi:hypothetical protein GQ55_6G063900 [Panicum hallii var. hallii]|uniref:Uncharacterized protein n=1 Tax=Panicum hallii var. hallii TaxID=1504633 RepID=A0A2T7D4J7_9POAL|nr:hypothetical protein GQ55_6G063900 [Panicum hallii var. hallii]